MKINLQTIRSGYDRKTCWVHSRVGMIPGDPPVGIITMQQLRLSGCDVYSEIYDLRSGDGGRTWSDPTSHRDTLGRRPVENGMEEGICDFSPMWHARMGVLLGTGHTILYRDDHLIPNPRPRSTAYSCYHPATRTWSNWQKLELPDRHKFFSEGAGSTQRLDLPNGDILLPTYFGLTQTADGVWNMQMVATVLRCHFDGKRLSYVEHGTELTLPTGRGFAEPMIARAGGRFFLTLRNNDAGYVAASPDGLHYDAPRRWTFDDGSDLGNYNTQQRWMTHNEALYLVYTRRGANNDHVFRHRAPLFIAQVDPQRLCVMRQTERILVPERGARLGNFGVAKINENESWVTVCEWMQTTEPNPYDCRACERYGSDNSVFCAKITF